MASRQTRMASFLNYRMRIVIDDGRILVGRFMAFDKHMNIILGDCDVCSFSLLLLSLVFFSLFPHTQQEFRLIKAHGKTEEHEEKRILGLTLLRGECVVSLSVEAPPTQDVCTLSQLPSGAIFILTLKLFFLLFYSLLFSRFTQSCS